ncbi:MAG: hypothetical protein M3068_14225 [Gemmatimonadota bacterium]|nr:hypothetical protein [Gemmatimonadota bacterium]MDQ6888426.1 hypothetical protein [Gemmatimonadota bacterium]
MLQTPAGQHQWIYIYITLGCSPVLDPVMTEPSFVAMLDRQGIRRCPVTTPWPIKPRQR